MSWKPSKVIELPQHYFFSEDLLKKQKISNYNIYNYPSREYKKNIKIFKASKKNS